MQENLTCRARHVVQSSCLCGIRLGLYTKHRSQSSCCIGQLASAVCVVGLDTGPKVAGSAAVANGKVVYQAEVELRNDITGKMEQRAWFRHARRGKNCRYRPARFDNRKASKKEDRLPPSIRSKIDSHLREVRFIESILPVTQWKFELASLDIHKITNRKVEGVGYQEGALKDYYNVKQYILHRGGYKCQFGRKCTHSNLLHVHHKVFRRNGASDAACNLTTLCDSCHDDLHAGFFTSSVKTKKSKTKHATEMGVIKSQLSQCDVPHVATFGYETKFKREQVPRWPKTHANDAVAACLEDVVPSGIILVKNHLAKGDYQQSSGKHSQQRIPTGKLFGLRKGDRVFTPNGIGFIKGKRSSGYFAIADLDGNIIHASKKAANCIRIAARSTTQIEQMALNNLLKRRVAMDLKRHNKTKESVIRSSARLGTPCVRALPHRPEGLCFTRFLMKYCIDLIKEGSYTTDGKY